MNRAIRVVMGVAVVSVLAPAMAVVKPFGGDDGAVPALAQATGAIERDRTLAQLPKKDPSPSFPSSTEEGTWPGEDNVPMNSVVEHSEHSDRSDQHDDTDETEPKEGSTRSDSNLPATTTTSAPADVLTGPVCPCIITGAAELKGEISLNGDLIVDGGSLVARPGVELDGNGYQIMFMNGGRADFQGSKVFTWSDRGAKQNLQRDINLRNLKRIMWMASGGPSVLRYLTVRDSGTPSLGDYPFHWHLNGNSTRGTIVEGVVVINGKNHAYVPHGSHGITFKDVIAKDTKGDAFWWDPTFASCDARSTSDCTLNNSNDIVYNHALADGVTNGPGDQRGFHLTGFRLGAGSGNSVLNSVAINVQPSHRESCSGFHWPEDANQNAGGNVWRFVDNHAVTDCFGIFVWQNDGNHHVVDGFTGSGINHGAYGNNYDYRSVHVARLVIHATGWRIRDSSVGQIVVHPHVVAGSVILTNVSADAVTMEDAPAGDANQPIELDITSSNLTCADVQWTNPHPQSVVVINGIHCER